MLGCRYRRISPVREFESLDVVRRAARDYELSLAPEQRKNLGQYFSGLQLGKLLAHLALDAQTRTVLDPMAGHGDLLDATWEAACERGIALDRLDGVEIDEITAATCRKRLAQTSGTTQLAQSVIAGDAFDPVSVERLPLRSYDLVITNPPYVRYQARNTNSGIAVGVRSGLGSIINTRFSSAERSVWKELAEGYSGLADLSVPAWLLAAAMVRPGGRLALVVPATWRTRNYADVIRYLLLRCFSLECIVEDVQPGWFSNALVRTHLLVARRLSEEEISRPLTSRTDLQEAVWVQAAPEAASVSSLVGASFAGEVPEEQFATWVRAGCEQPRLGIGTRLFNLGDEWTDLESRIEHRGWYQTLEARGDDLPLFLTTRSAAQVTVPDALRSALPETFSPDVLVRLEELGVSVGQGLRTGCNRFFYLSARGPAGPGLMRVRASSFFNQREFSVPADVLRPVLRRQSEMTAMEDGRLPDGRVLDLRGWVLPEDYHIAAEANAAYAASGEALPEIMPDELASYVRGASAAPPESVGEKMIPDLSAVRTNARLSRNGQVTPRFWYMLPDFAPRHLPAVFIPRVNHSLPSAEANFETPVLIDANFSTLWGSQKGLGRHALKALLNSVWCRASMEALGTAMGGGALKLEATHLRQMAVPVLSEAARVELAAAGSRLTRTATDVRARIDAIVIDALLPKAATQASKDQLEKGLAERANRLCGGRRAA